MSKFDELKKAAQAAIERENCNRFIERDDAKAVLDLLAIQAQLVEAKDALMKSVAGMLDVMSNAKDADLLERLGSAYKELHLAYSAAHALAAAGAQP